MLKPIRVLPSDVIDIFSANLAVELTNTLKFILMGYPVELTPFEAYSMPIDTFFDTYKKKSVMLKVDVEGVDDQRIHSFFEFNTAIVLGCLMRQMQDSMIQGMLTSQSFSGPVPDAFGEIGNQFTGTLDRVLRNLSRDPIHLILDFKKKVFPDETIAIEQFENKEEYIVWSSTITIQGYGKQKLMVLFPQSLFERIIGQKIRLAGIVPKKVILYSHDKNFASYLQERIQSRYFQMELAADPGDIVHLSKDPTTALICFDFGTIQFPLTHDMKIFAKRINLAKISPDIPMWFSMINPRHDICLELEANGLRGTTLADSKKELENWIRAQLKKIPVRENSTN